MAHGVAPSDGEAFAAAGRGFVRLNFGCLRSTLDEALARISGSLASQPPPLPPGRRRLQGGAANAGSGGHASAAEAAHRQLQPSSARPAQQLRPVAASSALSSPEPQPADRSRGGGGRRLSPEEAAAVETVQRDGIAVLHGLLTPPELAAARREFDALQLAAGRGESTDAANRGARTVVCTCQHVPVGATPALGGLLSHPRVLAVVEALLGGQSYVEMMRTNRYTPGHPGMAGHSDGRMVPPYDTIATQVFLDGIDAANGALTYAPGSHAQYFLQRPAGLPVLGGAQQPPPPPFGDDAVIQAAAEGFVPVKLAAGSVTFRIGQLWHAVNPVQQLRRSVSGSYAARRSRSIRPHTSLLVGTVETAAEAAAWRSAHAAKLAPELRRLWDDSGVVRDSDEGASRL